MPNMRLSLRKKWMSLSQTRRMVLNNVAWSMFGKAVSMVGILFVGILVGRYLGPEKYGLMNYVISFVALFEILSEFGLGNIEVRELAKEPEARDAIMGSCFILRVVFAICSYLLLLLVVAGTETNPYTRKVIAAYGICLFAFPFNVARNYFTSIVKNEYVVKSQITRTLLGAALKLVLLWQKMSLTWFILASGFDFFLLAAGYAQAYRSQVGSFRNWHFEPRRIPFFLTESFPLLLSGAAVIIYQRIDQVMIKHLVGEEGVGYFATAAMFVNVVLVLPTIVTLTVAPVLAKARQQNPDVYRRNALELLGGVAWLSILLSIFLSITAPWLIWYTYGEKYMLSTPLLRILAWKTVGVACSSASGQLIIVSGMQKWTALRDLLGCATCVGLNYLLLPRWGVLGAAWTTLITVCISGFLANALIPNYRPIFRLQLRGFFTGWKVLARIPALVASWK